MGDSDRGAVTPGNRGRGPLAAIVQLLDFSAGFIPPEAIRAAGFGGAVLYMSDRRPTAQWMLAKPARREYCDSLRAAGLEIVSNYQYGKGPTADWRAGYDGGCRHAEIALRYHQDAGGPPLRPIYAPIDDNPTLREWNGLISPFLRGWASVIGPEWTGLYGNARCIDWALEEGAAQWFWQHNWSGDPSLNRHHPAAHLHQIEIDKRTVAGIGVDVNEVLMPDYGQWSATAEGKGMPHFSELDETGSSPNWHHRGETEPIWFLLHTQEGNGTAESLARYLQRSDSGVSYHYTVDNAGTVVDVVDTDLASWSVMDANDRAINLCFAGSRAAWTRTEWLDNMGHAIDIAAFLAVQDCRRYGIPPRVITPAELGCGVPGVADHNAVTTGLGIGSHTDVGDGFPWDVFSAALTKYGAAQPNGADMASFLDETITNWAGHTVSVRDVLKYMDLYNGLVLDQLVGPGAREQGGQPTRWESLGDRTVVEALAAIGVKLGIDGFQAPDQ